MISTPSRFRISAIASPTFINGPRRNYILDSRGAYNPVARPTALQLAGKRVRIPGRMGAEKGNSLAFPFQIQAANSRHRNFTR